MIWQDTLSTLLGLSLPVAEAIAGHGVTLENAWDHPAIKALRERLVSELTRDGTIEQMLEASQSLREQHRQLLQKPTLTPEELRKLGVLSASAYALSANALAHAVTPQAIFLYTLRQLLPWLQRVAELGLLVARSSAGGRELEGGPDVGPAERARAAASEAEVVLADPLLRSLIETTHTLTQLLARRGGVHERA